MSARKIVKNSKRRDHRPVKKSSTPRATASAQRTPARREAGRAARSQKPRATKAPAARRAPAPGAPARTVVVIDNYDSFTYNLVQYLGALGAQVAVFRNDAVTLGQLEKLRPRGIVVSPGPGTPKDAGISIDVIKRFSGHVPILGVCLGHQAIGAAFGGRVVRADQVMHGKTSRIIHHGLGLFRGLDNPFVATRYHSLVVEREGLPETLEVTCSTSDAVIMGLKVKGAETWGVQFHPESILTRQGKDLLRNFLDLCGV